MRFCPECNGELVFEPGYADSWYEPGMPDSLYCPDCGWECSDHNIIAQVAEAKYWEKQ